MTFPNYDNIKFRQNLLKNRLIVFSFIFLKQVRSKSTCGTSTTAMMTHIYILSVHVHVYDVHTFSYNVELVRGKSLNPLFLIWSQRI